MANTTFTGPVISTNGFTGDTTGAVTAVNLTASGTIGIDGTTVVIANLPETDPEVVGQLWNNSGVLTVSAG